MDGSKQNQGNPAPNSEPGKKDVEKLSNKERAQIATALRLGQVANKASELTGVEFGEGEKKSDVQLILTNESNTSSAVNAAVEKKISKGFFNTFFLTKPLAAAVYRYKANKAIEDANGDLNAAFEKLKVENDLDKINSSLDDENGDSFIARRARLALKESGFKDKTDENDNFVLNSGEKVEKVKDEKTELLNQELKDLYKR